jgi:tripartite-type tricarboxylate transporter receptor subunit TctC
MVAAGKMRPLAVVNHTRLPDYKDIPTMAEAGFADVGTIAWQGMFAPAGTPKPVQEALFAAVTKAMQSPDVVDKFNKQHFNIVPNKSLDDAKSWLAAEMKHWQTITTSVKIDVGN